MWDERYAGPGYAYGTEPNAFLKEQAPLRYKVGDKVLSLAEGEGRNAVYLAGLGLDVTGVDGSAVGLAKAQALAKERGVAIRTVHADLGHYDPGLAAWQGVVSIWAHMPSVTRRAVHAKAVQALAPGGVLILEAYHPDQIALGTGGPKDPDFLADLAALKDELAGLVWLFAREIRRSVSEGTFHEGESAVVQLIGKKR